MRIASRAQHLGPLHEKRAVALGLDVLRRDRLIEARPSGARFELGVRAEQRVAAADAPVDSLLVILGVLVGERALGAGLARDLVLLGRQLLAPFLVGLDDFVFHENPFLLAGVGELNDRHFHYTRRILIGGIAGAVGANALDRISQRDDRWHRGYRGYKCAPSDPAPALH